MIMSMLSALTRSVPRTSFLRLTRSFAAPSDLFSFPFLTRLSSSSSEFHGELANDQIERFKSVSNMLEVWNKQRRKVSPDITLKFLIEVTNLIRLSKDYQQLSSPEFKQLLQASIDKAASLGSEKVVTLLWVIAKIKWVNFEAINKLASIVRKDLHRLSDKSIGLIPWALVNLKMADAYGPLLNRIVSEACHRLEKGVFRDSRALANICWALTRMEHWPTHFTPHVEAFLKTQGHSLSTHTLSTFLHAMSTSGVLKSEEWLFNMISNSIHQLKDTDKQSLILILWSIGNQKVFNKRLFDELEEEVLSGQLVKQYTPRVIATLIWCCARTRYYSQDLLKHLLEHVHCFLDDMTLQDMAMVAYSFGYLNYPCVDLLKAITARVVPLEAAHFQLLLNLSWACLINEVYPEILFERCLSNKMIERIYTEKRETLNSVHQLLQLDLAGRYEVPGKGLPLLLPHDRLQMLINAATFGIQEKSSRFQRNVANILTDIYGCVHYLNTETFSSTGYQIDFELLLDSNDSPISIPGLSIPQGEVSIEAMKEFYKKMIKLDLFKSQKLDLCKLQMETGKKYNLSADWFWQDIGHVQRQIIIEVDGPIHYAANCHHPLGKTVLKARQLRAVGWEVISVPHFEWCEFGFDKVDEMKEYLAKKLVSRKL